MRDGAPPSQKWLHVSLPTGSSERIPDLALFACAAFAFLQLSLSQPTHFLTFTFPTLCPHPTGSEQAAGGC